LGPSQFAYFGKEGDQRRQGGLAERTLPAPKTKTTVDQVGNVEVTTIKQGNRIIDRTYRTITKGEAAKA
jgi:hypothetical protein